MRRFMTMCVVLVSALSVSLLGCDSGSGDGGGTGGGDPVMDAAGGGGGGEADATGGGGDPVETGWSELGSIGDTTPTEIPADCGFDEALEGSGMGSHIANMKFYGLELEDGTKEKYELHLDCGGEAKAVWIFLSTGWCGACNSYAATVEKMYNAYKDQGLRVLWIVGEGDITAEGEKPAITKESFAQYFAAHAPMSFTVVRDPNFNGVYSDLDNTEPSLPHQYLLDATTMELIYKQGGTKKEGVKTVAETLEVDLAGVEELLGITFDE